MGDAAAENQQQTGLVDAGGRAVAPASTAGAPAAAPAGESRDVMAVVDGAIQAGYSPDLIERMMELAERYEANHARKAFYDALSGFRSEAPVIEKNAVVDYTSSKGRTYYHHASLDHVVKVVSPVLARYGLSFRWHLEQLEGGRLRVHCILSHRAGHYESTALEGGRDQSGQKNDLQGLGSTQTYLQRYTLMGALGLAAGGHDDDGNAGGVEGGPAHGLETVSDKQLHQLRDWMADTGLTEARFCHRFMIDAAENLPAEKFDEAMQLLRQRRTKLDQAAAQNQNTGDSTNGSS